MNAAMFATGFFPFLSLAGTIWLFQLKNRSGRLFHAAANGALLWTCLTWLYTYILSFTNLLYPAAISIFWSCYLSIILAGCLKYRKLWRMPRQHATGGFIIPIALITLAVALLYPPNNYDGLTYHMPRILHWLQNHSLAPYPTSIDRQIGMAPLNAILALQCYAPAQSDFLVNLIQWLAFIGCIGASGHLAFMLGGNSIAAKTAAIFTATLPCAIIQASNIDSCLLVTFFLCVAVANYIEWRKKSDFISLLRFGIAAGLAILSKGSAYPILFPFICLVAWHCLKKPKTRLYQGMAAALIVVILNLPHLLYNFSGTGNLIASSERNVNIFPAPGIIIANLLGNFLVNEPFLLAGHGLEIWQKISSSLGLDADNKKILPWGGLDQVGPYLAPSDGTCPNPAHTAAIIIMLPVCIWGRFKLPRGYASIIAASTFCFCAFLTWHPWISRIQTSLFVLIAPIFGIFASQIKHGLIRKAIACILLIAATWPLFFCVERPLAPAWAVSMYRKNVKHFLSVPREQLLFNNKPDMASDFTRAADNVANAKPDKIFLSIGDNGIEYPIWALLANRMAIMPQIEHYSGNLPYGALKWESPRMGEGQARPVRIIKSRENMYQ